ncbi:MAG: hypothetical protein ABIQ30_17530 [Devosia sp.]
MADSEYWFARYKLNPVGRGLRALRWQGIAAIAAFAGAMIGGGLAMLLLGLAGYAFAGVSVFVVCAIAGGTFFIWAGMTKSDPVRTVADYQTAGLLK